MILSLINFTKNGSNKVYDSLVDHPSNPQIFVSCHNDNQAYPELLLEFLPFEKNNVFHNNYFPLTIHRNLVANNPFSSKSRTPHNIFTRNTVSQPIQGIITPGGFQIF